MRASLRRAIGCCMWIAAGCTSDPVHFHSLVPPVASVATERVSPDVALDLRPVHIPPMADRSELVVRRRDGGVALLEHELWISPLQEELRSALSLELARQLTVHAPVSEGRGLRRITVRVDVQRFEGELGHYALIEADWRIGTSVNGSEPRHRLSHPASRAGLRRCDTAHRRLSPLDRSACGCYCGRGQPIPLGGDSQCSG